MADDRLQGIQALIHQNELSAARAQLYRVLLEDTQSVGALHLLAMLEIHSGRPRAARGLLERALELDNDNQELRFAIESLQQELNSPSTRSSSWDISTSAAHHFIQIEDLALPILDQPHFTNKHELVSAYWLGHPRYCFFKTVPRNARLLDIGAGSGGLSFWKAEPLPIIRNDIELYGIDLSKGTFFNNYVDYQLGNLDQDAIKFADGFFDAVLASHVFEHLRYPGRVFRDVSRVLKPGGRFYIEIPTVHSLEIPSRNLFLQQGIQTSTTNFYDDKTHQVTFDARILSDILSEYGFDAVHLGYIGNKYIEAELITYGTRNNDEETSTYGIWSRSTFAQYIVSTKR